MVKTVVKLGASWCQPCHVFAKTFEQVAEMEEYKDIEFKQMDIEEDDNAETLVQKYGIRSVPTTLILDENDELIYKLSGNLPLQSFTEVINDALKK